MLLGLWMLSAALADEPGEFLRWVSRLPAATEPVPEVAAGYRFAGDAFRELGQRVEDRPGVIVPEDIGHTHDGRPIWAFHIADPAVTAERKVLVFGGIHALEWISTEVALDLAVELAENPPPGVAVTVIPLLNPDGRAKVEADLRAGKNVYRRGNGVNVDLNRDFAVNREAKAVWRKIIPGYYATSPAPLSQPESQALDALAARERYQRAASLHAFGGFLYFPWSGRFARPPKEHLRDFYALGRAMEQAQGSLAYKTRQLSRWGFFFRAQGTEIDHLFGKYGTHAFLVELTRSGIRWDRPKTLKIYFRWYNPVRSEPHRDRGLRAMRTLVRLPPLPTEGRVPKIPDRF